MSGFTPMSDLGFPHLADLQGFPPLPDLDFGPLSDLDFGTLSNQEFPPIPHPAPVADRLPLEELLQEPALHQWQGYVTNRDDFNALTQEVLSMDRQAPDDDEEQDQHNGEDKIQCPTPNSADGSEAKLARLLFEAMCDFSDPFEERNGKTSFQVQRLKAVPDIRMELLSWEILVRPSNQPSHLPWGLLNDLW